MAGHIRLDKDLPEDARTLALGAEILSWLRTFASGNALQGALQNPEEIRNALGWLARTSALGVLVQLWIYADTHAHENNGLDVTLDMLADVTRIPVSLFEKLPSEWLRTRADGIVELPEYVEKNALLSKEKRKIASRERVRRFRSRQAKKGNALQKKKRNARNAVTCNARNAARNADVTHSRARSRPRATGTGPETTETGTGPVAVRTRKTDGASAGELASAQGASLAVNRPSENGYAGRPPSAPEKPTEPELEAKARRLATAGFGISDIVKALAQFGVEAAQVTAWLANALGSQVPA